LTVKFQGVENTSIALLSLGLALAGLGEWINHPFQEAIVPPGNGYPGWGKLSGYPRRNTLLGNSFLMLGLIFVGLGVFRLVST
ncbi:MAG: hypothetical protein VX841_08010, partial [Pseudomonadota bacterium]|nr:hypothetical protein [Pseudomonadota bacterium]